MKDKHKIFTFNYHPFGYLVNFELYFLNSVDFQGQRVITQKDFLNVRKLYVFFINTAAAAAVEV